MGLGEMTAATGLLRKDYQSPFPPDKPTLNNNVIRQKGQIPA